MQGLTAHLGVLCVNAACAILHLAAARSITAATAPSARLADVEASDPVPGVQDEDIRDRNNIDGTGAARRSIAIVNVYLRKDNTLARPAI